MDYSSDGCTGFPDGEWKECCIEHDLGYANTADFTQEDIELFLCVADTGNIWTAILMLVGLLVFGPLYRKAKGIRKVSNDSE